MIRARQLPAQWDTPTRETRLLVVAPHPDDETLACGGLIARAAQAGARVSVVWLTCGDGSAVDALLVEKSLRPRPRTFLALGERRMREADAAAARLGVVAPRRYFLGYPDAGLAALVGGRRRTPFMSPFTRAEAVPYTRARSPGAPYTREGLERELAEILDIERPTWLLAPHRLDRHPDHRAAALLVRRVRRRTASEGHALGWIVHGGRGWPSPRGLRPHTLLHPPPATRRLHWVSLTLTAEERDAKREALAAHASQLRVMRRFLHSFVRANELYVTAH